MQGEAATTLKVAQAWRGDDAGAPGGGWGGQDEDDRAADQFEVTPSRLAADAGFGSAEMLGWLVDERAIKPHLWAFDKSERTHGTFARSDFALDPEGNRHVCPGGNKLKKYYRLFSRPRDG